MSLKGNLDSNNGLTLVELLIVITILIFLVIFSYKLFFSQTKVVTQSLEYLNVNEGFRKVLLFLSDDIKEATNITEPVPILSKEVNKLMTKTGVVLHLFSNKIDPTIPFNSPFGGQIGVQTEVVYELEKYVNPNAKTIPRYRLIRTETIRDKPGHKLEQRQILLENLREFMVFRTVRRPFRPGNVSSSKGTIVVPRALYESGTGNSLVNLRMTIERTRKNDKGQVYQISMDTCFYKRGREVFKNP